MIAATLLAGAWLLVAPDTVFEGHPQQAATAEIIAVIQVHGNNATPDAEVLAASGITVGAPFTDQVLADVRGRLLASNRYEDVTVLKRYASIADPTQIAVVILIDE